MAFETVKWGRGRKEEFASYFHDELWNTLGDRAQLERKWLDLITQWRARVIGDGTSDVPFIGASDLEFPLTALHSEPVYSDLMQTLHIPQNFWTVTPLRKDMQNAAKPFERFLSIVEKNHIKMRRVNTKAFIDLVVLGTCVYKSYIHHSARMVPEYDEGGEVVEKRRVEFSPRVQHIPLQNFYIPAYADCINPDDVGGAPWVAHRFELTEGQFKLRADDSLPFMPKYDPQAVKTVLSQGLKDDDGDNIIKERQRQEDEYDPFRDKKIELYEVWARFDVDKDGHDEDVVVVWHQETQTVLRATYNPFMHGKRPFASGNYIPGFGFYGVGVAEQDEWAQIAQSRLLNSGLNNSLLSNQIMLAVPQGANFDADEPIHAGKIWSLGPGEQIQPIQMGQMNPSIFQMMGQMLQWSEGRTGVSDLRQGNMNSMPSRTPASTTLAVLQEGNKKFDMILSNLRGDALAFIGQTIIQNLIQISRTDPRWQRLAQEVLGPQDALEVRKVLTGPINDITDKLGISVTATSSQVNKEVEKQSSVALMQIAQQVYPAMLQFAQLTGNQQLMVGIADAAIKAHAELLKRMLEQYDIRDTEPFIPDMFEQQSQQPQQDPLAAMMGQGQPQPGVQQPQAPGGPLGPQQFGATLGIGG